MRQHRQPPAMKPILVAMIREEVEARKWDIEQLAHALQSSEWYARKLLAGGVQFRDVTAFRLSRAFGVSQEFFVNLQAPARTYER